MCDDETTTPASASEKREQFEENSKCGERYAKPNEVLASSSSPF